MTMIQHSKNIYDCNKCKLKINCKVERLCFDCGELKKANEWCIKNAELFCIPCYEKGNYRPLYLYKKDKWSKL